MSESPAHRAPGAPLSARCVDSACLVLGAWTLCCHLVVTAGGSFRELMGLAAAVALAGVAWRVLRRSPAPESTPAPVAGEAEREGRLGGLRIAAVALGGLGALVLSGRPRALWVATVALLGLAALLFVLPRRPRAPAPAAGRGLEAGLWLLALASAAIALVSHRIDIDDSFYVNLAVAAVDAPGDPLLAGDTLHGIPGLPLHLPVYRLHSWELWNGAVSRLTGLPAIASFHFVSAALVAMLVPLALARLLRLLAPRHWLFAVAAVLWVWLVAGDVHRWYGNFALVRMWQGKAVFLSVLLPLVYAYALDFALRPTRRGWILLASAQIAALGCTSSAVWAAPTAALAATAAALPLDRNGLCRLGLAFLASAYVLGAGLMLKPALDAAGLEARARLPAAERQEEEASRRQRIAERHAPGRQLERALGVVTGEGGLRKVCVAALLVAWACCAPGLGRRFAVVVPLAVVLVLLNPWTSHWVARTLVGPSTWRTLWALPIPVLLALMLAAPLELPRPAWLGRGAAMLALALFALVPQHTALSAENRVELGWPRLKVDPDAYELARTLTEQTPPGAAVVAPLPVAVWLSTFHDRTHPLIVRPLYLLPYEHLLGSDELLLRKTMTQYVDGDVDDLDFARRFARGLERYDIRGVVLLRNAATRTATPVLLSAGFERVATKLSYEVWVRR